MLFSFMRSHLLTVGLSAFTVGVLFREYFLVPLCSWLFLTFCSSRYSISGYMLRSLIHLDLCIVQGDRYGSICILLHEVRLASFLEDTFFFPLYDFCLLCKKASVHRCVGIFWGL